ncbi:MAG TPA: hypothetical protein VME66_10600 [Candidatus Acidoferrales bacterium]|nr:hypothetical protein [Candidatus Acidoferrales bacterium]
MRHHPLLLAVALSFLSNTAPASAAESAIATTLDRCQSLYLEHQYAYSIVECQRADAGYRAIGAADGNWFEYVHVAVALQTEARDDAALGHHRAALHQAIEAHQLVLYTYAKKTLDPDDYANLSQMATDLRRFEDIQRIYIQRGIGD